VKSDEFIREVEEELQRERLAKLWHRFGHWVIAAAGLVVLGTAGKVGWESWRESRIQARANAFTAVEQRAGQPEERAHAWLELAQEADDGFAALARLRAAAALREAGRTEQAAEALAGLAASTSAGPFSDLAALLASWYRLESADATALAAELEALGAPGRPFRHTARELQALTALRAGDQARAREQLSELIQDATAPVSQQQRLQQLLELLGAQGPEVAS
jgi:hypothetical protein